MLHSCCCFLGHISWFFCCFVCLFCFFLFVFFFGVAFSSLIRKHPQALLTENWRNFGCILSSPGLQDSLFWLHWCSWNTDKFWTWQGVSFQSPHLFSFFWGGDVQNVQAKHFWDAFWLKHIKPIVGSFFGPCPSFLDRKSRAKLRAWLRNARQFWINPH